MIVSTSFAGRQRATHESNIGVVEIRLARRRRGAVAAAYGTLRRPGQGPAAKTRRNAKRLGCFRADAARIYDEMVDSMTENLATLAGVMLEGWLRLAPIVRSSGGNKGYRRRRDICQ